MGSERSLTFGLVALVVMAGGFFAIVGIVPVRVGAATLYVGGGGPGNYTSIQAAIDASNPGDTVHVFSGTYHEQVSIAKSLSLVGQGSDTTIIDGGRIGTVVNVTADRVNVAGFTVTNSSTDTGDAGIKLFHANNSHVTDNNLTQNYAGIEVYYSNNNTVAGNTLLFNNDPGVHLDNSRNNAISDNIFLNDWMGIWAYYSSDNTVANNTISHCIGSSAIGLWSSNNNTIASNIASNCSAGISLRQSEHNIVDNNTVSFNYEGIGLMSSGNNTVTNNTVSYHTYGGLTVIESSNVTIVGNRLISNQQQGITLNRCNGSFISGNEMVDDGLVLTGDLIEQWNTHKIDSSNRVNGKPVYYWKNTVGGTIPPNAGEVILANSTGVVVDGQNVSEGDVGIELGFSSRNAIANSTFSWNTWCGAYLWESDDNIILNNNASKNPRGIHLDRSNGNRLVDNRFHFNSNQDIRIYFSWNSLITGSVSSDSIEGVELRFSDNSTIANNTISDKSQGISIYYSHNNSVTNNTVSRSRWGISLDHSRGCRLVGNVMIENGILIGGDSLEDWNDHEIDTSNKVNGKPAYYWKNMVGGAVAQGAGQVILANTTGVVVKDQNFRNVTVGVELGFSSSNSIANNTASGNLYDFSLFQSTGNTIANNTLSSITLTTIELRQSNDNMVYHNNLNGGEFQVIDDSSNSWDNGYPSGGNHWSDYAGADLYSGPGQNQAGSDGIGDTPVDILGGANRDRYPLMSSWPWRPSAPQNLRATRGDTIVTLTWAAPATDGGSPITNYTIYRGTSPGDESLKAEIGDELTYTDTGLINGQTYYYEVSAKNMAGEGPYSTEVNATPATTPSEPLSVIATAGDGQITITWTAPASDGGLPITNYTIYRGSASGGETLLVTLGNVLTYTDTSLTNGQTYYYRVTASNAVGEGSPSIEVSARPTSGTQSGKSILGEMWFWLVIVAVIIITVAAAIIISRKKKGKKEAGEPPGQERADAGQQETRK